MKKQQLVKALKTVANATSSKSDVLIGTDAFVFGPSFIYSYNNSQAFSYPLESGLDCSVRAQETLKTLERMKGDDIEVEREDSELVFSDGQTELRMNVIEGDEDLRTALAAMSLGEIEWKPLPEDFLEGLRLISYSISTDSAMSTIGGAGISGDEAWSSDNFRVSRYKFKSSFETEKEFTIPREAVMVILRLSDKVKDYFVGGTGWINFKTESGVVFSSNELFETFPLEKLREILGRYEESTEGKDCEFPDDLDSGLDITEVFSMETDDFALPSVSISRKGKKLLVAGIKDCGKVLATIPFKGKMFKEGLSIRVNPTLLRTILGVTKKFRMMNDDRAVLFQTDNFLQLMATYVE